MIGEKLSSDARMKPRPMPKTRNAQLQQLQDEIDRLALLVNEAKHQSDRIQAAADALGDAAFEEIHATVLPFAVSDKRHRKTDA